MSSYQLTAQADGDLIDIWLYTDETWSEEQADKYVYGLHDCFDQIAIGHKITRSLSEIHPKLETCRCQEHQIFLLRFDQPIIIAVLHGRMELMKRLASRLATSR